MDARHNFLLPSAAVRRFQLVGRLAWIVVGVWLGGLAVVRGEELRQRSPDNPWPTAIILEPPANRDTLLGKLRRPDLLIWDAASFDRWRAAGARVETVPPSLAMVAAVRVVARPEEVPGRVSLRIDYHVTLATPEPAEVSIGLDGLILGRVTAAGQEVGVINRGENRSWAVRLVGQGEHLVAIETTAATRPSGLTRLFELAIPPAASTEIELITRRPLIAARAGADEPLTIDLPAAPPRARGSLSPRPRLEVAWQESPPPGSAVPPLLAARGELVVTPGLETAETRETWSITALRGSVHQVVFELEPGDSVVDVEVDHQSVVGIRRPSGSSKGDELVVALAEALTGPGLGSGATAKAATIVLTTRRPRLPDQGAAASRFTLVGHSIRDARTQNGVIGVVRPDDLLVEGLTGRRVRRIDPQADLPESFRTNPERWLGFAFAEQPFSLGLRVEALAPRFEVAARSTAVLQLDGAEVSTNLAGRVWQGKLFEVRVLVPPGLTFEPTAPAPDGLAIRIEQQQPRPGDTAPGGAIPAQATAAIVTVTFPRPLGPGETFGIPLRGHCRLAPAGSTSVGLFQPLGASPTSTEIALVSNATQRFELRDGMPGRFARLDPAHPPAGWIWPAGVDSPPGWAPLWLRADGAEAVVPVRVDSCPRTIRHRTDLTVAFDRTGAEVVAELAGDVANGSASALEIALPPDVPDAWSVEAGEGVDREPLDPDPVTGWRRCRLKLAGATDTFLIRVRYRQDYPAGGSQVRIQPIRVLDGRSTGQTIRLSSASDVALVATAPGWVGRVGGLRPTADSVQQVRQTFDHLGSTTPTAIDVVATLGPLAALPSLVASRLWLRSAQMPDGQLATTAHYRLEAHARFVEVRLPAGSRWVRALAGAVDVGATDVEQLDPNTYRMTLPAAVGPGPVLLRIDSILDSPPVDGSWPALDLVGGVVQQTVWELRLLGARAGVGVPPGWADENVWYREGFLWKRKPNRVETELAHWLGDGAAGPGQPAGVSTRTNSIAAADNGPNDFASGRHSYLFSRPGPPTTLHFPTYARSLLLLVCSGPVLVLGLLILARRPPVRWVTGGTITLGFLFVATVEPNTGLIVAESSSLGIALALIAAAIHATLDRRGRSPGAFGPAIVPTSPGWDPAPVSGAITTSGLSGTSNDPTVVRPAPGPSGGSTSEYSHDVAPSSVRTDPAEGLPDRGSA